MSSVDPIDHAESTGKTEDEKVTEMLSGIFEVFREWEARKKDKGQDRITSTRHFS